MKTNILKFASLALAAITLSAAPVITVGASGNSLLSTPTGPFQKFGTLYNFDSLTPNSTFASGTYAAQGVTISSPDGLMVLPYSTQSAPNELYDNSTDGSANITIDTFGTNKIGIGIADSDPVTIDLQALNASGVAFGTVFAETIQETGPNPGNNYFVISDSAYDIYGVQITQPTGNANYSGLAIDDLQVNSTPEPATVALLGAGSLLLVVSRLRKRS